MERDKSPQRTSIPDALIFLEYEDTANCKFFLVGAEDGLNRESHRALCELADCTVASRDALRSKNPDLHTEAARLWDMLLEGGWDEFELRGVSQAIGGPCFLYKLAMFE